MKIVKVPMKNANVELSYRFLYDNSICKYFEIGALKRNEYRK